MKKFHGFYTILSTLVILTIFGSSGAYGKQPDITVKDSALKASGALIDREQIPQGLTKSEWGRIIASIVRDRYRVNKNDRNGNYHAPNRAHGIDATGKDLGATMTVDNKMIRLIVDDHEAVYPITIDPFIETKKLLASDAAASDRFGDSVAISGDTAIVGARFDDDASGSAYVFYRDYGGTDNWGEVKKFTASDGVAHDVFGKSVSISGDTAIIGAFGDDDNGDQSGSAYVFYRDEGGADNWGQVKKLTASDGATDDNFGYSVSISGDTAIVGAAENGIDSGSAYVFSRDQGGADNWGQVKKLLASDGTDGDWFGWSVSISGDTIIAGAFMDYDYGSQSGSVYIFYRDDGGADNWGEVKKLTASDGAAGDNFGYTVSISGDTIIVGARWDDDNGFLSGSAHIFSRDQGGADNWGEVKKLLASDGAAGDYFGDSVSISEDKAIVGAHYDSDNGGSSGSAYIFSRDHGGVDNWGEVKKLTASDGAASDQFGYSVSISGSAAIVGAPQDIDNFVFSGSAYIFAVTSLGDELAVDLGASGLWDYDGTTWTPLSGSSPAGICGWSEGLAMDFSNLGLGLWNHDGSAWTPISGTSPEAITDWSGGLAMDFGALGLWSTDGSTWTAISGSNVEDMVGWANGLAMDFGAPGLWNYDGTTWTPISGTSPEGICGWSGGLAMDFGASGLWNFDGTTWNPISGSDVGDMAGWPNGLAMDFGASGLWNYDGSTWTAISGTVPESITGWSEGLAMDFGASGLYSYDGTTWTLITGSDVEDMDDVDLF